MFLVKMISGFKRFRVYGLIQIVHFNKASCTFLEINAAATFRLAFGHVQYRTVSLGGCERFL